MNPFGPSSSAANRGLFSRLSPLTIGELSDFHLHTISKLSFCGCDWIMNFNKRIGAEHSWTYNRRYGVGLAGDYKDRFFFDSRVSGKFRGQTVLESCLYMMPRD
jgi:hypothetical protein